jgi:hypothetical protein
MTRTLIESYRNVPGEHCGSTAMRNLIRHYCKLELTEAMVFGLGSGIDFVLIEADRYEPGVFLFGRSATMETDVADALGLHYTEQTEPDDARAWAVVRDEVAAGRPTMLSGDALYLDYRDFRVHFPAHRFVLLGFDDEARKAMVADRIVPDTQACSYEALAASRNPKDFISTVNLWGKFHDGVAERDLPDAVRIAIGKAARRMLDAEAGGTAAGDSTIGGAAPAGVAMASGICGLSRLASRLPTFLQRPNARELARYAGACIESFGTGGGNFRLMYAAFLEEAREKRYAPVVAEDVAGIRESARDWTDLSSQLRALRAASPDVTRPPSRSSGRFETASSECLSASRGPQTSVDLAASRAGGAARGRARSE